MNQPAVVFASVVLSAAVAFGVTRLATPERAAPPATAGDEIAALRREVAELAERIEEFGRAREAAPAPAVRSGVESDLERRIEDAIARALEARGGAGVVEAVGEVAPIEVAGSVVELIELGVASDRSYALWERIRAAGQVDEVIAAFGRRAAENPGSPDAQVDYGEALGQQIMHAENTMEQARLSMKADAAYDQALALDSTHWRARFNKAVSYSFWPPITGKPAEAVTHFETLVAQQEARPEGGNAGYVQTYVILGNLLNQQGKGEQAKEVWERGLRLHPESDELARAVGR